MQLQYGGRFYKTTKPIGGKQRDIYSLRINGRDCVLILKDLINDGCIIKFEQAKCAQRYIDIMDLTGDEINKEKHKLYERIHSLNQRKIKSEIKPYHIIDIVYIAGFFDAEGSISVGCSDNKGGFRFKITQKNDTHILKCIEQYLKMGSVNGFVWAIYNPQILPHLKEMLKYCLVKKVQLECLIKFIEYKNSTYRNLLANTTDYRKQLFDIIQHEKHMNLNIISESDIERKNIEQHSKDFYKMIDIVNKNSKVQLSEKKMEIINKMNNSSDVHAIKISASKLGRPCELSDEKIYEVLSYKNDRTMTGEKVAAKCNISRKYVGYIWSGHFKPNQKLNPIILAIESKIKKNEIQEFKNEFGEDKYKYDKNIATQIGKRLYKFETILEIVKLKKTHRQADVAKLFKQDNKEIYYKVDETKQITDGHVSNLWRKICLYECEFTEKSSMSYLEYKEIVNANDPPLYEKIKLWKQFGLNPKNGMPLDTTVDVRNYLKELFKKS
jgi:hypothetical protein